VLTVQALQTNLVREFDVTRNGRLPSMIFVDIQKSQIDNVAQMIDEKIGEKCETVPTVRARVAFINGNPIDYQQREIRQQQLQTGSAFSAKCSTDSLTCRSSMSPISWLRFSGS